MSCVVDKTLTEFSSNLSNEVENKNNQVLMDNLEKMNVIHSKYLENTCNKTELVLFNLQKLNEII